MALTRREAASLLLAPALAAQELPDLSTVTPDLETPPMQNGDPAPGRRVRQTAPEYKGTEVHHALYLPSDWKRGGKYPVIVEYAGNGNYRNQYGDVSTGRVEGSNLGYGLSGGKGFLWVCMPYVNEAEKKNQITWWGDLKATVEYCRRTVPRVCEEYGGDPESVILTGFSRGAIACNHVGLHNEEIAKLWLAFIPYSHYDGVRKWGWERPEDEPAITRLRRLRGRAQFICHERSIEDTKKYLEATGVKAPFTFQPIAFRNHNDGWTLRDIPERRAARAWLTKVLKDKPGR
jgi:hypothetical protein